MYDGSCDQTKELQKLSGSMSDDNKWIISSSGRYMFVILSNDEFLLPTRFLAKIHNGNHILYWTLVQKVNLLTHIKFCSF